MNVYAASNPYSSKGPYGVNCTWYTWKKVNEKTGISLPAWGNAKTWYTSAENAGYSVGKTPKKFCCCMEYYFIWTCRLCRTSKWK